MINLKELRLYNWVYSLQIGEYVQIASIDSEFVTLKDHVIMFDHVYVDMIEPIPLTEEILLKCGFDKDGNFYYIKSFKSIYLSRPYLEANHLLLKTLGGECISKIKHLHQLQNIYFALNGEELKIDL